MTKKEMITRAEDLGLAVGEWSPGDGATRYRFCLNDSPDAGDYHGNGTRLYTALGLAEARTFLRGYSAGLKGAA